MFCANCGRDKGTETFCSHCGTGAQPQQDNQFNQAVFGTAPQQHEQPFQAQQQGFNNQQRPASVLSIVGLILGILAMTVPVPVLDIVLGVAGLVLGIIDKNGRGLRIAAIVVSVIGTLIAISFTISFFTTGGWDFLWL